MDNLENRYLRKASSGLTEACISNVYEALRNPKICGVKFRQQELSGDIEFAREELDSWESLTEVVILRLRIKLEIQGFEKVNSQLVRDSVHIIASENKYIPKLRHDW